jgi:tRNA(Ile)-lysidine synthase
VQTLVQKVSALIRRQELLKAGDRVGVAVSGGADSVALLRLFLELRKELGIVLSVVHFNHKLRGAEADGDEHFVAELARQHKLELHCESGDVAAFAAGRHLSLEAAARELRYAYFVRLLTEGRLNRIATAHTLDDQAETVLLRLARGAGTRGLAGIYPQWRLVRGETETGKRQRATREGKPKQFPVPGSPFSVSGSQFSERRAASVVRPLLGIRRKELEVYLANVRQGWREDKSNRDLRHARNRVRHGIMPRLERNLNPAVREALAETAEIARAEEEYWQTEVARVLPSGWLTQGREGATLSLSALAQLPLALQRRVIRTAAEWLGLRLEFRQVEEIRELGSSEAKAAKAVLPGGWLVLRKREELQFERELPTAKADYDYSLSVPGRIEVLETGTVFETVVVPEGAGAGYNPEHFFDPTLLNGALRVRNWRAGDRFWPAHTKAPKKIKELLQERHVETAERKAWPVMLCGDEIVWVRGFPAPARLRVQEGWKEAIVIRESPLGEAVSSGRKT